jgi:hypothetical protein
MTFTNPRGGSQNGYANLSTDISLDNRFEPSTSKLTVKQTGNALLVRITVSSEPKLSDLQRFILKAAYANRVNKATLILPWGFGPWRDLTDEEVALLYYDLGEYEPTRFEPEPPTKVGPFTFPGKPTGFSRRIRSRKIPREAKAVARAAISRVMKRLSTRGLIKRFGKDNAKKVLFASCDLTAKGFLVAERLANTLTVIYLPNTLT